MNGKILVDTNILAELLEGNTRIASFITDVEICISGITEIELLSNPALTKSDITIVEELLKLCIKFDVLLPEIKLEAAKYRRKKIIKKTPDAIIAGTARYYSIPLLTMDKDFKSLSDIDVIIID